MEDEYGFSIDSTNVLELESDNYVSYTMKINRDTPNNSFVENLLIEIDSTGTPKASIVSYNPTPQWINNFQNNLPQSYEGAITLQPINYNPNSSQTSRMDCIYVLVETTHHCTGIAHDYSGVFDDCWVCGRPSSSQDTWVTSEVLMVSCTNSGGSGGYYSGETGTDSNSSNYNTNNNGGQTASNNQDSSSSDSTSYTGTGMVVTLPDYVMELAYALDIAQPGDTSCFSPAFFDWYNNTYAHLKTEQITDILAFLNQHPDNPEAQEFAMAARETLSNQNLTSEQFSNFQNYINAFNGSSTAFAECIAILNILNTNETVETKQQQVQDYLQTNTPLVTNVQLPDYKTEIQRMTSWMRVWGNPEYVPFADYIDSIINDPNFNSFPLGDVIDLYNITRNQYLYIKGMYFFAVVVPIAEAAYPFIVYAVIDASLGVALPLLSKIPLAWVTRGEKLEAMLIHTSTMGIEGTSPHIRIIESSSIQAEALFTTLTKDRISISYPSSGVRVANMGNGNYITYRNATASGSGFSATLEYNYVSLFGNNLPKLKFQ